MSLVSGEGEIHQPGVQEGTEAEQKFQTIDSRHGRSVLPQGNFPTGTRGPFLKEERLALIENLGSIIANF
ncbi:MAG: hypothetical protein R2751_17835 [Bacteroidales bacterium]